MSPEPSRPIARGRRLLASRVRRSESNRNRAPRRSGDAFIEDVRLLLTKSLLPRLRAGVATLSEADVWWRPNEASNSVGNLVLHLAGNVRQWIVHGIGGEPDVRKRAGEFAARGSIRKRPLLATISRSMADAVRVLERLDPARLGDRLVIQGYRVSVQGAMLHVAEHFSYHTGQILYVVKMRSGRGLGFYAHLDASASKNVPSRRDSVSRRKPRRSKKDAAARRSGPP
ncbi:MAG: DUF1572 family protein [Planctomycetes bacterium]|nr:DUF1572 family protein [Planctomycetota bacterium]